MPRATKADASPTPATAVGITRPAASSEGPAGGWPAPGEIVDKPEPRAEATLKQHLADILLGEVKAMPKPWQELGENEQRQVLDRMEGQLRDAARAAVFEIASHGFPTVRINISKVEFTPTGSKVTAGASSTGTGIHELAKRVALAREDDDRDVIVVLADANAFVSGDLPEPDRDQLELIGLTGDDSQPFIDIGSDTDTGPVNTVGDDDPLHGR